MTIALVAAAAISGVIAFVSGTVIPAIGAVEGIVYTAGVLESDDFLGYIRYNGVVLEK